MPVQYGGDKITFADGSTVGSGWTGMKNRLINGGMVVDQRNAGSSVTPANNAWTYSLDRWSIYVTQASKLTVQQVSDAPTGFKNSFKVTSSSAYSITSGDIFSLRQSIEGYNFADFMYGTASANTFTLSFWVKSSLTGTFGGALQNDGGTRGYAFTYTINSANTWEQKTVTVAGDTAGTWVGATNGNGISVLWGLGVGADYSKTAGSWGNSTYTNSATGATSVVGTNGATFYITGVQLEKGSTATSFDYRPYGTELALCQRYFEKVTAVSGYSSGSTSTQINLAFNTQKRAVPTISVSGTVQFTDGIANYTSSGSGFSYFGNTQGGAVNLGGFSGMTTSRPCVMDGSYNSYNSFILASAEL